jgi:hypothetical protein
MPADRAMTDTAPVAPQPGTDTAAGQRPPDDAAWLALGNLLWSGSCVGAHFVPWPPLASVPAPPEDSRALPAGAVART